MSRDRILQAASTMFCRCGLRGVSIEDICHFIGIAKKTFYLFYEDKDDLVKEFVEASFSKIHVAIQDSSMPLEAIQRLRLFDSQLMDFLRIFYPTLIFDLRRHHNATYQIFSNNRVKLIEHLVSIIELGKQQGTFRMLDSSVLAELRFNELETIFSKRNEIGLGELQRNQQELFDHYLAGLILK
ncbi:MAG TPA: TetR/AcrR family transcriptional regulator [Cyclobacteriaceae bacterium]|jgi:AcrR family transcriptional regulator|nr:TetR/AcrR family transcriptional regulator [Cyclobacteriaceae bacterium]